VDPSASVRGIWIHKRGELSSQQGSLYREGSGTVTGLMGANKLVCAANTVIGYKFNDITASIEMLSCGHGSLYATDGANKRSMVGKLQISLDKNGSLFRARRKK
jgi:hypothetical protein